MLKRRNTHKRSRRTPTCITVSIGTTEHVVSTPHFPGLGGMEGTSSSSFPPPSPELEPTLTGRRAVVRSYETRTQGFS